MIEEKKPLMQSLSHRWFPRWAKSAAIMCSSSLYFEILQVFDGGQPADFEKTNCLESDGAAIETEKHFIEEDCKQNRSDM